MSLSVLALSLHSLFFFVVTVISSTPPGRFKAARVHHCSCFHPSMLLTSTTCLFATLSVVYVCVGLSPSLPLNLSVCLCVCASGLSTLELMHSQIKPVRFVTLGWQSAGHRARSDKDVTNDAFSLPLLGFALPVILCIISHFQMVFFFFLWQMMY